MFDYCSRKKLKIKIKILIILPRRSVYYDFAPKSIGERFNVYYFYHQYFLAYNFRIGYNYDSILIYLCYFDKAFCVALLSPSKRFWPRTQTLLIVRICRNFHELTYRILVNHLFFLIVTKPFPFHEVFYDDSVFHLLLRLSKIHSITYSWIPSNLIYIGPMRRKGFVITF